MTNFEQTLAVKTWAEQRDELLNEIRILTAEKENLSRDTKEAGLSLADLHRSISESYGRIDELKLLEERYKTSLSSEVAELQNQKSRLETEIETKQSELRKAKEDLSEVLIVIDSISVFKDGFSEYLSNIKDIVTDITTKNKENVTYSNESLQALRNAVLELIDLNNKNVIETNIVINKVPAMLIELQKNKLIREKI